MIKLFKKNSGFSLVEVIIVCVLISVLIAIGVPAYLNSRHDADKQKAIFNLYAIYHAQKMFYFDQEPREYASMLDFLTPAYATISQSDGTWNYSITDFTAAPASDYEVTAEHLTPAGMIDGFSITIDQTGTIDDTSNWPPV